MAREVILKLGPLERLLDGLRAGARNPQRSIVMRGAYKQWVARYLGFARKRYERFSRGGGTWPPLKPSTIRKRRKGRRRSRVNAANTGSEHVAILRDTGTMFGALDIGRRDNFEFVEDGVRVGFLTSKAAAGQSRSPRTRNMTIADLAGIHHFGKGHNPVRELIVEPDRRTTDNMERDLRRAVQKMIDLNI